MRARLLLFLSALAALCGCTKTITKERVVENPVPVEPVTWYYYQGEPYSVHTLESYVEDGYYYFLMAREPQAPYLSRIELIVPEYNLGKILDFSDLTLSKGIDYVLLFEDTEHFYSPAYAPKSGTLQVRKNPGQDSYKVKFDIVFRDDATLKFDFNGEYGQ